MDDARFSTWIGPALCVVLLAVVASMENGGVDASLGHALSLLLVLIGVGWAVKGTDTLRRLSELYVWLAFILSMYHLQVFADALAGWIGLAGIDVFRGVAVVHVLLVGAALGVLGAWSRQGDASSFLPRLAVGILIVGAVIFWVGARTFPGMALEEIQANLAGHRWTSIAFLLATVLTLAGFALFTLALRDAGDRFFSVLGLLAFLFGSVFWVLHLAFRLTVMVEAAQGWDGVSAPPPWFEPWRAWAALLFGLYTVLAYLGLAAYGGALLKTGWLARWVGWTCVVSGVLAVPLGGLPLLIHVVPWLFGILLLRRRRPWRTA